MKGSDELALISPFYGLSFTNKHFLGFMYVLVA